MPSSNPSALPLSASRQAAGLAALDALVQSWRRDDSDGSSDDDEPRREKLARLRALAQAGLPMVREKGSTGLVKRRRNFVSSANLFSLSLSFLSLSFFLSLSPSAARSGSPSSGYGAKRSRESTRGSAATRRRTRRRGRRRLLLLLPLLPLPPPSPPRPQLPPLKRALRRRRHRRNSAAAPPSALSGTPPRPPGTRRSAGTFPGPSRDTLCSTAARKGEGEEEEEGRRTTAATAATANAKGQRPPCRRPRDGSSGPRPRRLRHDHPPRGPLPRPPGLRPSQPPHGLLPGHEPPRRLPAALPRRGRRLLGARRAARGRLPPARAVRPGDGRGEERRLRPAEAVREPPAEHGGGARSGSASTLAPRTSRGGC